MALHKEVKPVPSTSKKQHNLMEAVAHSPAFAKKVGIKQSVGKDFAAADKGKKFGLGGNVGVTRGGKGQIGKQATRAGSIFGEQKEVPNVNLNKYVGKKEGGKVMKHDDEAQDKKLIAKMIKASEKKEPKGMKKGGSVKPSKMGSVKTSPARDGVAERGHTKGRVC